MQRIFQFANIAGPRIVHQPRQRFRRQRRVGRPSRRAYSVKK
jgi:hypothetical protein